MTSLVTGGCGFVGRHLVRRLLELGHDLWIIDDLSTGLHPDRWLGGSWQVGAAGHAVEYHFGSRKVTFIHEDLSVTMLKQLGTIKGEKVDFPKFDLVFALASVVGGRATIEGDPMHVAVDLGIDALFFLWLVRNAKNVGKVLYASSSAAYPIKLQAKTGHVALREETIDFTTGELGQPDMTYGWSKLTGEYLSHLAATQYGIHIGCVRPFSGYGEDQDLSYPVPAIAYRVARGDDPVAVWGTGEQGRDFVHIEDCITAMILTIDRVGDGSGINIGTGTLTTFLEVAGLFVKLAGRRATVLPTIGKPVGVQSRYCDPCHMEKVLGWRPGISLKAGFQRVLDAAYQRVELLGKAAIV
jgi:nucleoside-diphosphate-sugar epimerase